MSASQSAITKEIKERIEQIKPEFSEYIIRVQRQAHLGEQKKL